MLIHFLSMMLLFFIFVTYCVNAAVMHSHSVNTHKEREVDGAYSPRDHSHYSDSGEHYNEFDHEAILGNFFLVLNGSLFQLKGIF